MSTAELFIEIGCEELPAGFVEPASAQLVALVVQALDHGGFTHGTPYGFATPRRLAVSVPDVALTKPGHVEKKLGPPRKAAYAPDGTPTKTAIGFATAQGVDVSDLKVFETPKGEYVGIERNIPDAQAEDDMAVALQAILVEGKITFKKSMRYGDAGERFARPVRWLVCLLGGKVLRVELGAIKAGNQTRGHRFLSPEPFAVGGREDYVRLLRERHVLADVDERRAAVQQGVAHAVRHMDVEGGSPRLVEDPGLVAEVTNLVEWPATVVGSFDEAYLDIPREVLVAAMRGHQRYFAVEDGAIESSPLLNRFVTVAGTEVRDLGVVRAGNERVLRSRLADARFFWDDDRKRPLESRREALRGVTFQAKLGSYFEKQERVAVLARELALEVVAHGWTSAHEVAEHAARAASLCKCDLVTGLVREFPELQGVLGGYYAINDGEPLDLAKAIAEHYLPRTEDDPLPQTRVGAALAMADKLDSIAGLWSVGLKPTGTKDPYAIRQQAIGVLRILFGRKLGLSLRRWIGQALLPFKPPVAGGQAAGGHAGATEPGERQALVNQIADYFLERQRALFLRDGAPTDVVEAVLGLAYDDPVENAARVTALFTMTNDREFVRFFDLAKRVRKIAPHERRVAPGGGYEYPGIGEVDETLLSHPLEKKLWTEFCAAESAAAHVGGDYLRVLEAQKRLIAPVDEFFNDGPKVLAAEEDLRRNRTTLCARLDRFLCSVADLSAVTAAKTDAPAKGSSARVEVP